jgi:N6-adenosine-specific RNA methylase IME4
VKYATIVADPPWEVERACGGANYYEHGYAMGRPMLDYPTLTLAEIAGLPVGEMAFADAHLYVWTTGQYLEQTPTIVRAWGFVPSITLTWCKPRGGFVGGAFYANTEFVIFARRGTLPVREKINSRWFEWPRGAHSAKPEAFLDMVERVSPSPRLEMFARRNRLGWDTWGDEALEHVEIA